MQIAGSPTSNCEPRNPDAAAESKRGGPKTLQGKLEQAARPADESASNAGAEEQGGSQVEPTAEGGQSEEKADKGGLYTFSDEVKLEMYIGWIAMAICLVPDMENPNNYLAQIGARVNHGQKQAPTMMDIINNIIGNKAEFEDNPRPNMDNDLQMWRVLGMVST